MFYALSLVIFFFFAYYHDLRGVKKNRDRNYTLLLLYLIGVSGFQYMVGTDIYYYVLDYEKLDWESFQFMDLFSSMEERRQPGWMLLMYGCRTITSDFFLPKMILAIFFNIAVLGFFKKESKAPFLCVFVYVLMGFLVLNFNVLRQSVAIGFSLYALSALKRNMMKKFLFFVFLSFMFHNSAVVLLGFVLFKYIRYNKTTLYFLSVCFIVILFALTRLDLFSLTYSLIDSGFMGDSMTKQGLGYMQSDWLGVRDAFAIFSLQRLFDLLLVVYYIYKTKDLYWGVCGLCFILIGVISGFMPILWRFRQYMDFGFYIVAAGAIYQIVRDHSLLKRGISNFITVVVLLLLVAFPIREYLTPYDGSKYRYIDQYYPYNTIFFPSYDKDKMNYFI